MLDFGPGKRSKPSLAPRTQRRFLLPFMMVAVVLLLVNHALKGDNWQRMLGDGGAKTNSDPELDTVLATERKAPAVGDAFVSPAEVDASEDRSGRYFPGVRPGYLSLVRDDSVLRSDEHHAWFHLLDILSQAPQEQLEAASADDVSFVQLFQQPTAYRGELVTVRGSARRVYHFQAPKNLYGIKEYYQVWLQPEEINSPHVVYCLDLPEGFPVGDRVHEDIEVTGFFYKRYAYAAGDAIRTAPLTLAKTLRWEPAPVPTGPLPNSGVALAVIAGLVGLGALMLRRGHSPKLEELKQPKPEAMRDLNSADVLPDVGESLRRLSRE